MKLAFFLLSTALAAARADAAAPAADSINASPTANARAALTRDLGRNLVYHRIRELPQDLPAVDPTRKQPRVLDLRYVRADGDGVNALHAWLKSQATPRTPVFVLANSGTDRDLIAPLIGRTGTASLLVIGAATRAFHPDIAVEISGDDERRAYDAFETGVELTTLLTENPHKIRNDEASLSRDRSTESPAAANPETGKATPPPPIDAALQRAVHLHRTLVALRKI